MTVVAPRVRILIAPLSAALVMAAFLLVSAPSALAFQEPNALPGGPADCQDCHWDYPLYAGDCTDCHASVDTVDESPGDDGWGFEFNNPSGPHGGYQTVTRKCRVCHTVHNAPAAGVLLLPASTIYGTCSTCHDGTGGWGVYGTLAARSVAVGGGHRYDQTNVIPGGDPVSGGPSSAVTFKGAGGSLTCSDCHSPHGSDTVTAFIGDRVRMRQSVPVYTSSKLLRRSPTGAPAPAANYGSDWCLTCHQGRDSELAAVHNHPVETVASAAPLAAFTYANVARLVSNDPTGVTEYGALGGITTRGNSHGGFAPVVGADNRGFLMPYPRTTGATGQAGHDPICQQCHEDTRSVGALTGDGSIGDAATAAVGFADSVTWNGTAWVDSVTDNPRFQNFPHETQNDFMLVETADDLCTNCHPAVALP